jgi:hypothetical protein
MGQDRIDMFGRNRFDLPRFSHSVSPSSEGSDRLKAMVGFARKHFVLDATLDEPADLAEVIADRRSAKVRLDEVSPDCLEGNRSEL